MRKILITGGAGFVGRHFCKYFLDQGDEVYCVDPIVPLTGGIDPAKWPLFNPMESGSKFTFLRSDCRDFFKWCTEIEFDYAFHLAAMVGGREMIENNPLAVADDLSIDAAFWQWAARAKPKKIVSFSSSAAYPVNLQAEHRNRPLSEGDLQFSPVMDIGLPDTSYGWAKLTNEYLAKLAYEKHGLKSVVYRPFSGYGEDQDMAYPFPAICKRVKDTTDWTVPFKVWGTGNQKRDFIHIDDVVEGVISTMDKIDNAGVLNLSTGIGTSFKEFARMAAWATGIILEDKDVVGTSDKPEGVFSRVGNTEKQNAFGFKAKISLNEGIARMMEHLNK